MTAILDHAITVRDILYLCLAFVGLIVLACCAAAIYLQIRDRRRIALHATMRAENAAAENLRNPAYGTPKSGIKWQDGRPYVAGDSPAP